MRRQGLSLQSADFQDRAVSPVRELGAYEALWAKQSATLKSIAKMFRENPGSVPSDFVSESDAEKHYRLALSAIKNSGIERFGIRVHGAGEYPLALRHADHPVEVLYYRGWWDLVNTRCVAVVGTRDPSTDGRRRTVKIVKALVKDRFTVVSGLARGIDAVAHQTAIENDGWTIGVIGTPITKFYPKKHKFLQQKIADDHLIISQVPIVRYMNQNPSFNRYFFPERNITMSALTEATIIVEASNKSGTLVQARAALKQNRKLFILDSCFRHSDLTWPKKFEERGAIRVCDYDDVIRHLAH